MAAQWRAAKPAPYSANVSIFSSGPLLAATESRHVQLEKLCASIKPEAVVRMIW